MTSTSNPVAWAAWNVAGNNHCAYTGKDGYIEFYKSTVMTADVLIYAGRMVDRYLSSRWKMFFDRIFFNTHTPVLTGKQVAFVISGPFSQVPNLMEIFGGFFGFQGANIVGVVSDESGTSARPRPPARPVDGPRAGLCPGWLPPSADLPRSGGNGYFPR